MKNIEKIKKFFLFQNTNSKIPISDNEYSDCGVLFKNAWQNNNTKKR